MKENLIEIVEKFLDLCDKMHRDGKLDDDLYIELTKNKIEFLAKESRVG